MKTFKKYLLTVGLSLGTLVSGTVSSSLDSYTATIILNSESSVNIFCSSHTCLSIELFLGKFYVTYETDDGGGVPEPEAQ